MEYYKNKLQRRRRRGRVRESHDEGKFTYLVQEGVTLEGRLAGGWGKRRKGGVLQE